jgi:hypothetical protein
LTRKALSLLVLAAVVLAGCTRSGGSAHVLPLDVYASSPALTDVTSLLGGGSWWPGPPSFGVRPLDVASTPFDEEFTVTDHYINVGTAERFDVETSVWSTASTATTHMNAIKTALGTSATGPNAGDAVLYYGQQASSGAARYVTFTFVRVAQVVDSITWSRKDAFPSLNQLGRIAAKLATRIKDLLGGKIRGKPLSVDNAALLPPTGPDLTLLGTANLPVEADVVMLLTTGIVAAGVPEGLAQAIHGSGADTVLFGDYALNKDTHMEVRAAVMTFSTGNEAVAWLDTMRGTAAVNSDGIAAFYDDPSGQYVLVFQAGTYGAMLICRSTADTEAASRACETPIGRVAPAWRIAIGG